MRSADLDREYIVGIPENYDPNTPYRLVFGMHPMGGSATGVRDDHWYNLQQLDTKGNTIWVAPQGYTDGAPWRGGDNKDHVFFEDIVKLLNSELCIDTSRVFSLGWSFGSMITNSLAQTHQDVLRGVVVYSTADFNIYFPPNSGKPLAYMGVHGIWDNLCPLDSGRRSAKRFVTNNGCTDETAPEATFNGKHISHAFKCPSNYPVRWVTFNGPHSCVASDPGESTNWVPGETWQFISQF
jgi:poly(3-hydroxybutyrate) depolymerase